MCRRNSTTICSLLIGVVLAFTNLGFATEIEPGFDLFQTIGELTHVEIPQIGEVYLDGVPIGLGNTDTIMRRSDSMTLDYPDGTATTEIELVALFLKSVSPVDITDWGYPGVNADLYITVNALGIPGIPQPDALPRGVGYIQVKHTHQNGGTFDTAATVYGDFIFTSVGGDPSDPEDVLFSHVFPDIVMTAFDNTWSLTPGSRNAHNEGLPHGGFFALIDPDTNEATEMVITKHASPGLRVYHGNHGTTAASLLDPVPTVSEWGLVAMTLLALTAGTVVFGRRRRSQMTGTP